MHQLNIGHSMSSHATSRVHLGTNQLPAHWSVLAILFLGGFAAVFLAEIANRIGAQGLHMISTASPIKLFGLLIGMVFAAILFFRLPELGLALFFLVGLIKGDPRLESVPMDLTLAVAVFVIVAVCVRMILGGKTLRLPSEYVWYLPLLGMMLLSLTYTPDVTSGVDKSLRFVCLTSIGIVAPFVLFDEPARLRRFFLFMTIGGFGLSIESLASMQGESRLVSPSGLNTELGGASAVAIIIIWGLLFPEWPPIRRFLLYPVLGILALALVGSGGRFANLCTVICVLLGAFLCRKLFGDILIACAAGLVTLPFIRIPEDSLTYLSSLSSPSSAMGTRHDLLLLGIKTFLEHPLFGVGVSGFRWLSPNPITYNYPHNLILELGSEMGVVAVLCFFVLAYLSFRESIFQLRNPLFGNTAIVPTVFLLLVYAFLEAMISGDINDSRFMWFMFGLPFVLRQMQMDFHAVKLPVRPYASVELKKLNPITPGDLR